MQRDNVTKPRRACFLQLAPAQDQRRPTVPLRSRVSLRDRNRKRPLFFSPIKDNDPRNSRLGTNVLKQGPRGLRAKFGSASTRRFAAPFENRRRERKDPSREMESERRSLRGRRRKIPVAFSRRIDIERESFLSRGRHGLRDLETLASGIRRLAIFGLV